jgi:hypothetical protein
MTVDRPRGRRTPQTLIYQALSIEIQQHRVIALQPGLIPHMPTRGGGPSQPREMGLTPHRRKRSHRRHVLETDAPTRRQTAQPNHTARLHELDVELLIHNGHRRRGHQPKVSPQTIPTEPRSGTISQ